MDESAIRQYIIDSFSGAEVVVASKESGAPEVSWGDTFFFHQPGGKVGPDHRFPFATIVTKDYENFDVASNLNRAGIFRLNIGVSRRTFRALFGESDAANPDYDFAALDRLMPHPVYGKMFWVSILNPGAETFEKVKPLLTEAYSRARGAACGES
jgi:hypothetical protein